MKFELNEIELERYQKWFDKLPKKYKKLKIEFIFSNSSGIGTSSKVRVGDKECDLTDFSCW